ncbi:hypothetical protein [Ralstonia mojiangensis]|uniref:hypothetical protein n=1 Tax=Ralstonia mojiangensis TaxID=2953895 RepID=UPI002090FB82|nr:hypothetical protein [Ralstonia mojiangensis]MCO5411948.1 hypothetical protein [Ralstonia mojiangensis]
MTPDSVAKIDVISSGNAVTDLKRHFEVDAISIDKIRVERPFGAAAHSMELSRNGLISVDDSYQEVASDFLLDLLMNQYMAPSGSRRRL